MPVFESTEKMYEVLGTLFRVLAEDPVVGPKYRESNIVIKFTINDPDGFIWLDRDAGVICGPADLKPTIEMTLSGDSYEDIYLSFKDFMHGKQPVQNPPEVSVYPPESDQMFFHLDNETTTYEIPYFKGGFSEDIARYCVNRPLNATPVVSPELLARRVQGFIPDFYW